VFWEDAARLADALGPAARRDLLRVLTSPSEVRADVIRQLHERPDGQEMADLLIFLEEWEWARQGISRSCLAPRHEILGGRPTVQIQWSEVEAGHWRAVCQCGSEDVYEKPTDRRVRNDPLDSKTSQQCEFAAVIDPAMLRVLLKVKDGAGGSDWWIECGGCAAGWQVPHYAVA